LANLCSAVIRAVSIPKRTDSAICAVLPGHGCICECIDLPVCRHNHRDKHCPGWHLEQAGSRGWFRWTTPSRRSYLSGPTRYPS